MYIISTFFFSREIQVDNTRAQDLQPRASTQVLGAVENTHCTPRVRMLHELRYKRGAHAPRHMAPQQHQPEHQHQLLYLQHLWRLLPAHTEGRSQGHRRVHGRCRERSGQGRVLHEACGQRYSNRYIQYNRLLCFFCSVVPKLFRP